MRNIGRKVLVHLIVFSMLASLLYVGVIASAAPPPTISSVNPNQGIQGQTLTSVTINGNNFTGATSVSFGSGITVNSFTVVRKQQITANITISSDATPGARTVSVTTVNGQGTLPNGFTVNPAPPTVSSVNPNQGIQGQTLTSVTINGNNFTGATSVSFGSGITVNSFAVDSPSQITAGIAISSASDPGTRNVSVTTAAGTGTLPNGFTVNPAPPTISSVDPNVGVQEQTLDVIITGTYLTGATAVAFGSGVTVNSFTVDSSTQITASISISFSATPGPRDVSVTTPGGIAISAGSFGINQAPPSVNSINHNQGTQGDTLNVTISGTYFTGAYLVSFGAGIDVNSFSVDSDSQISANISVMPDAATGPRYISVTTTAGTGTLANGFTVSQAPPDISALDPDQGTQGQTLEVIISGTHFTGTTSVSFGPEISVNSFTVISDSQISVNITIDPSATPGYREVSVTTPGGVVAYLFVVNQAPPVINSVAPNEATQGQTLDITITGAHLTGAMSITFGPGVTVNSFVVGSDTSIVANITVSPLAVPGQRDVSVTTPGGNADLVNGFTIIWAAPSVTSVNPNQAAQKQTLNVTINGTYLTGAMSVTFGPGVTVNSFTVNSHTQITANISISPGAMPGPREVSVTAPGGTATLVNGFTVTQAPPDMYSVGPNQGIQGQTLNVTITGTYFTGATVLSFGSGITVNSFTADSDTQITANIAISALAIPGPRSVSVTTPSGTGILDNAFVVKHAPPAVISVSPNKGVIGQTIEVTITGTYLSGATLVNFGTEVIVNSFDVESQTRITAQITINPTAAPGARDVTVTTPGGTAALTSAFSVSQGIPSISSVTPNQGLQGQTLDVTITGDCLDGTTSVSFGPEITVNSFTVDSTIQITANITISPSATPGLRSISVITPDGTDTLVDCFTVNQAPPTITSVTPNQGVQGQTLHVTIAGRYLIGTTSVSFGSGITVNSFTIGSATQLTASITIGSGAALGFRDVGVSTTAGTAIMSDGFTVNESTGAQAGTGWYEQHTTHNAGTYVFGQEWKSQTFTPSISHYFNQVSLCLYKAGNPTYTVTLSLHNVDTDRKPVGVALASTTFSASSLTTTPTWRDFIFTIGYDLSAGTEYALVLSGSGGDTTNRVLVRVDTDGGYSDGLRGSSTDGGATWKMVSDSDMAFKEGQYHLYETFTLTNPGIDIYGQQMAYQTFTPSRSHYFDYVSLSLLKVGKPTYMVTIALHNVDGNGKPTGTPLCTTGFSAASLMTTATWQEYRFATGYQVSAGTKYALVLSGNGGDAANKVTISMNATGGYNGGEAGFSSNGGASWQTLIGQDIVFNEGQFPWHEQYLTSNTAVAVYGPFRVCQTFTPVRSHYLNHVSMNLYRAGNPIYEVTISLYNVDVNRQPAGDPLCSTTFPASSLSTAATWRDYWFPAGCQVFAGTEYALVISGNGGDANNRVLIRAHNVNGYAGGQRGSSSDNGLTWQMTPAQDLAFREGESVWYDVFTANNAGFNVYTQNAVCQTFTPSRSHYFNLVSLALHKIGNPTYVVTIALHNVDGNGKPTGTPLCTTGFSAASLTTTATWRDYRFETGYPVSAGTEYVLVISGNGGNPGNCAVVRTDTTGGYSGGQRGYSSDGGATWQMLPGDDMAFREGQSPWYEIFTLSGLGIDIHAQSWGYQTFTPKLAHRLDYVSLFLQRQGTSNYTVTLSLHEVNSSHRPVGPALCSTTFAASSVATTATWYEYRFAAGYRVSAGTTYAIVISGNGGDPANKVIVRINATGGYAAGQCGFSTNNGTTWQSLPEADIAFREGQHSWYESFMSSNTAVSATGQYWACQTFTPSTSHYLNYVSLFLYKIDAPTYLVTISVYNVDANQRPTGNPLCSTTFDASLLTTTATWYDFRFDTGCQLTAGTRYAIVIHSVGDDTTSRVMVRTNSAGGYASGQYGYSTDGGTTWVMTNQDIAFREGGWQ